MKTRFIEQVCVCARLSVFFCVCVLECVLVCAFQQPKHRAACNVYHNKVYVNCNMIYLSFLVLD